MGVIAKNFAIAAATVALIGAVTIASAQTGGGTGPTNPLGQGAIIGTPAGTPGGTAGAAGTTRAAGGMGANTTGGTGATGGSMSNQTGMATDGTENRNRARGDRAARRTRG